MSVSSAGDDTETFRRQSLGQHFGISDDLFCIIPECGLRCFKEADGFGGDDMHQRTALQAWEYNFINGWTVCQDHTCAWATQSFVGSRSNDVRMRYGRRMRSSSN